MRPAGTTRTERECRSKLKPIFSGGGVLRATPTIRRQVCGKPGCKCRRGEKHAAMVLTRSTNGKIEQLHISRGQEAIVQLWIQRYHDIRDLLENISAIYWDRLKKKR